MSNSSPNQVMGLLIDTDYCTGCHTCEVACQKEHDLDVKQWGIKLTQVGPFEVEKDVYEYRYSPVPTQICDLCAERRELGKTPLCVQSCLAKCMSYGTLEELVVEAAEKRGKALWVIGA